MLRKMVAWVLVCAMATTGSVPNGFAGRGERYVLSPEGGYSDAADYAALESLLESAGQIIG